MNKSIHTSNKCDVLVAEPTATNIFKETVNKHCFWGIPRNDFLVARTLRDDWGVTGGTYFLTVFEHVRHIECNWYSLLVGSHVLDELTH